MPREKEGEQRSGSDGRGDRGSGLSPTWLFVPSSSPRHYDLNKREVTVSILLQETEVWAF